MGRVDDDVIPEAEGTLVFIAANVREARRAEDLLTTRGVDYCLSFETYLRSGLFSFLGPAEQTGVGFTVASTHAELKQLWNGVHRQRTESRSELRHFGFRRPAHH
jgi:hypothetical protein